MAAFSRCKFRLSVESVGTLLQAAIGGIAKQFGVSQLGDRTFIFVVSTKSVGLFLTNLRSFACDSFKVFFFQWGNGNPNWRSEYSRYLLEEASSWSSSSSKSGHRSFADVVKSPILSSANAVPLGSHRRPAMTVTGANAVHLGPHRRSAMSARKQSVFDRLIFPRVAAHSSSSKEVSP